VISGKAKEQVFVDFQNKEVPAADNGFDGTDLQPGQVLPDGMDVIV
jgi:hypothetical protein